MDGRNWFVRKVALHERMDGQADPPKEDGAVKKMNGRLLLLLSNKMTHYFKEWTTAKTQ